MPLHRFIPHSLNARIGLASCLLLPLIIGVMALVLERAYNSSLQQTVRERLELQTYVLLGAAEAGGGELWMPPTLQEARFSQPGSGVYGLISNSGGELLWRSDSSLGVDLTLPSSLRQVALWPSIGEPVFQQLLFSTGLDGGAAAAEIELFSYSYRVLWETETGQVTEFLFTTLERPERFLAELNSYRIQLWSGLALLVLLLLGAQALLMHWGLKPLQRLATEIKAIEAGRKEQLQGLYPREVQPLTRNLNLLLDAERARQQRYRDTLGDLAHSLKTPLAVLRNEVGRNAVASSDSALSGRESQLLHDQVDRMDAIISHQLGRAGSVSAHTLLQRVPIQPVAHRIGQAMAKVYPEHYRRFDVIGPELEFTGDERDLMELLGNLIDNAFKYGNGRVQVETLQHDSQLQIRVDDDGNGVAKPLRQVILQRGSRADSIAPGQGIGLSVVRDIIHSYNGALELDDSPLGGARFTLVIPVMTD
ncbi:MAG: ATP-binding protein [Motiliproteus sp.]